MDLPCGIIERNDSWIEIKGSDAKKFLNGLLTNDINKLQGKSGCYALILAPKGKIIADLFCYTCGDYFGITCTSSIKQVVLENLKKYIIFQKVDVIDRSEKWGTLSVLGTKAEEYLQPLLKELPTEEFSYTEPCWGDLQLFAIYKKEWGLSCYDLWTYKEKMPALKEKMNLPILTEGVQEALRIESGTPLFGVDFDETTIPQEANLYHALSFTKGCFVGQEIVARLEHRGHVGKQLVQFILDNKMAPPPGEKIFSLDGQEVGYVTSSCVSEKFNTAIALGYLRYAFLNLEEVQIADSKAKIKKLVKEKVLS